MNGSEDGSGAAPRVGIPSLTVVDMRGARSVHVRIAWKTGVDDRVFFRAHDGISARRIERAVRALVQDGMVRTPAQLAALGFTPVAEIEEFAHAEETTRDRR